MSLPCSDYKILAKALALLLKKVIEQVVHVDQTYCVPGRSSAQINVALERDLLELAK